MTKKIAVSLNLDRGLMRYNQAYQGIVEYCEKFADWQIIWDHYPEYRLRNCDSKSTPYYDAIIGRIKNDSYKEAQRLNIPCLNLWYNSELREKIPSCLFDYYESGKTVGDFIQRKGYERIIMIDSLDDSAKDFLRGVEDVVKKTVKVYVYNRKSAMSLESWSEQILSFDDWTQEWKYPIVIISSTASPSAAITTLCKANKIIIPVDVSIILGDSEDVYNNAIEPAITSVDTNYKKIGFEAAKMLDALLNGNDLTTNKKLIKV